MREERVLQSLLKVVVDEWGVDHVEVVLSRLKRDGDMPRRHSFSDRPIRSQPRKTKPNPSQLIETGGFEGAKREVLLKLADRFEKKNFLPSTADIREFMYFLGERPGGAKNRRDAFRVLLQSLARLSTERLEQIEHNAQHSGPSQLGPLSDAIANAGARLTRQSTEEEVA